MKFLYYSLGTILALVGLNAMISGFMMILDPTGKTIGLTVEMLSRSPFTNYLIPAFILFTINGLGSLGGAFLAFQKSKYIPFAGLLLGAILCGWILIQVMWIEHSFLHTVIFVMGCLEMILSLLIIRIGLRRKIVKQ